METKMLFTIPPEKRPGYFYVLRKANGVAFVCNFAKLPVDDHTVRLVNFYDNYQTAIVVAIGLNSQLN